MSQIVIITAIGAEDKPGIVAALTGAVYETEGNLDDATMTRLHGAFATMLAARFEDDQSVPILRAKLDTVAERLGLHIRVEPIPDARRPDAPDHLITVYGADKAGIVHAIAALLSELGVNITDLDTRVAGAPGKAVYVMLLETSGGDWNALPARLAGVAVRLGFEVSHREIESEAL